MIEKEFVSASLFHEDYTLLKFSPASLFHEAIAVVGVCSNNIIESLFTYTC